MSHSVVRVTENKANDSLILVVAEDGTVSPDKETVQSYLNSRAGATELQVMHVNKVDGQNIDVTLDTLMYVHSEEIIEEELEEMDQIAKNLKNFRLDHDYTPFTSPKRESPVRTETELEDELAQTLSILEGTSLDQNASKSLKTTKSTPKQTKKAIVQPVSKQKAKMITTTTSPVTVKQTKPVATVKVAPRKPKPPPVVDVDSDDFEDDEDFDDLDFEEDDDSDSDFELEDTPKMKVTRRTRPFRRSKSITESPVKTAKHKSPPAKPVIKPDLETKNEKPVETVEIKPSETKPADKKPPPKKEKKIPKPPDDFLLFSTPDIIRRVGGKEPSTPPTPTTPDVQKYNKPAKLTQDNRSKSTETKLKRMSTETKLSDKTTNQVLSAEDKLKDRRMSVDKPKVKTERLPSLEKKEGTKFEGHVSVQGYEESMGSNSSESLLDSQLQPLPSAEDIRAIIQNENTKSFTTSLVIPDSELDQNNDPSQVSLETAGLDLEQSILDNINSDLISEDILYQVAQSLVDNPELQNVIDKSIVDGNLILDPSLQQAIAQQEHNVMPHSQTNNIQPIVDTSDVYNTSPVKGTQIVRSDGRIVVIPPIERPTTRSRNKPKENPEVRQVSRPVKPLDNEHVSGNELDTSNDEHTEEDESEDDPNKLWCICNQPHNNRFMICCDTCEEWYHGKCVNVTKAMGQMMEQEGREWICLYCKDPLLKRPSAAARRIRKASRTSTDSGGSQRKLSTTSLTETPTTPPTMTPACIVCGKPSRNSSIYCSDSCILKHAQGVEKVVVFDRKTGKILSGSNAPSASNLEKWLQEHPSYEVVRSTSKPTAVKKMAQSKLQLVKNTSNDGISLAIHRKGVNIGVLQHSPKSQSPLDNHKLRNQKKITGLKIISKQVALNRPKQTKLIQPVPITKTPTLTSTPSKPKIIQPVKVPTTPTLPKEKPVPQKTPKSRQAEITNVGVTVQQPRQENIRDNVRKTLMEQLVNRIKMVDDLKLTESQVTNISSEIENQLYKCFGDTGQKYRNKYRSLIFNIKDVKNQTLWRRICEKSINPYQLVRLSPDDLASQELALWREREAKHQLDMIKKSELELLNCNRQYVFKTHKGEQVFEDDRPTDQTVTEVITGLGADSTSLDKEEIKVDSTKDKEKKILKHNKKDKGRDQDRKSSKEKNESKEKRKDHRSSSRDRDRDRRKRSRSREHGSRHEKIRSRSRDRDKDRHRRSSHKSSRHKKEVHSSTDKLDKKSKEILEQLVDKQIVPPLEDRLWKHVPQEDIIPTPNIESDSDHEPSSTVTIPTPPRSSDQDEVQSSQQISDVTDKIEKGDLTRSISTDSNELMSPKEENSSLSPTTSKTPSEHVWKGTINMVDVAQISITAHEVSGDCSALDDELPGSLDIVGRISPDTVWDYIGKMRCSNSKIISLLRLNATNMEEKMPYIALYSYLSSRNRLGVVKSTNKAVKDFYILPLASQKPIPQALLPISGPGFEESRPPLLLGIIVRDKRKRPLLDSFTSIVSKRTKIDVTTPVVTPPAPATPPIPTVPPRSYTPPPNRDPRLKVTPVTVTAVPLPTPPPVSLPSPPLPPVDDMDEPYSPEDSDPDATTPPPPTGTLHPKLTTNLPIVMTPPVKSSTFLDTPVNTQTFKPFVNKFDTIPGLEDAASLPASSLELQRKMAELDQRIAMQKAEIDNMSQDIASSASTDIGTSALANIALPSNLQQILDSIKTIGAVTNEATDVQATKNPVLGSQSDLTIPLMLPKISSRPLTGVAAQKLDGLSPTIPLNLPKIKSKHSATNSPQRVVENEKSSSVLSSLSEEDLIRKAAEMLGETESTTSKKLNSKEHVTPTYNPPFNPSLFNTPPPPIMLPPPPLTQVVSTPPKRSKLDMNQPPIPGLEDEC